MHLYAARLRFGLIVTTITSQRKTGPVRDPFDLQNPKGLQQIIPLLLPRLLHLLLRRLQL